MQPEQQLTDAQLEVMWPQVLEDLERGWRASGEFDEYDERSYRRILKLHERRLVVVDGELQPVILAAVQHLAAHGAKWRPSAGEIGAQCMVLLGESPTLAVDTAPAADEVVRAAERAAFDHRDDNAAAIRQLTAELGPVAGDWLRAVGPERIRSAQLGHEHYGRRNAAELGDSYREHLATLRNQAQHQLGPGQRFALGVRNHLELGR